jgi:hypothetical protein
MQISESRLRDIIREELEAAQTYKQVIPAVKLAMNSAQRFVSSIEMGNRDVDAADALADAAEQLAYVVKLLRQDRAPEAGNLATLARLANEMAQKTGFWKTPTLVGRKGHIEDLKKRLDHMKRVAQRVASSVSASIPSKMTA